MNVIVTEKAIAEIKRIIQEQELGQDKVALRVRVLGGGCSGFTTKLDLDEVFSEEKDVIFTTGEIRVAVDKRSALYLEETKIDFHDGIDKRGFIVDLPAAKSKCGCGSSFSM